MFRVTVIRRRWSGVKSTIALMASGLPLWRAFRAV